MKQIDITVFKVGNEYSKRFIAKILGYKDGATIQSGVSHPADSNIVLLFSTLDEKANIYPDRIEGDMVYYYGQKMHANDKRIACNFMGQGEEALLFFYRNTEKDDYKFYGQVELIDFTINTTKPSLFTFIRLDNNTDIVDFEDPVYLEFLNSHELESEDKKYSDGKSIIVKHVRYERNPKNRKKAIQIHGCICSVCQMDFNVKYGKELAQDYIEVHHILPLSKTKQKEIDPSRDLVPVCSNCHRMLHRRKNSSLTIDGLKKIVIENGKIFK